MANNKKNKEPKYQEALIKSISEKKSIGDLISLHSNIHTWREYENNLYCPDCEMARLTYVSRTDKNDFLRAVDIKEHTQNCPNFLSAVHYKTFNSFCNEKNNNDFIHSRLEALLRKYCLNDNLKYDPAIIQEKDGELTHDDVSIETITKPKNYKRIPRKSISVPLSQEDYNIAKIYYGYGNIKWEYNDKSKDYILYIGYKGNEFCSLHISDAVYKHIDNDYKTDQSGIYLAFCASLNQKKEYNGFLRFSSHLFIIKP